MIKVEIKGLNELVKAGEKSIAWKELFRAKMRKELHFFGVATVGTSQKRFLSGRPGLNVVTGRLRSSINYLVKETKSGFGVSVGTNVVYAPVHEFGDSQGHIRPRPFLQPAVEAEYGGLQDNLEKIATEFTVDPLGQ